MDQKKVAQTVALLEYKLVGLSGGRAVVLAAKSDW